MSALKFVRRMLGEPEPETDEERERRERRERERAEHDSGIFRALRKAGYISEPEPETDEERERRERRERERRSLLQARALLVAAVLALLVLWAAL